MQISTTSSQEIATAQQTESAGSLRCPVCSGALVPLPRVYRCSRCAYHVCVGCEQFVGSPAEQD